MPSSRGSSQPRYQTQVSHIAGRFFTSWDTREVHYLRMKLKQVWVLFLFFFFQICPLQGKHSVNIPISILDCKQQKPSLVILAEVLFVGRKSGSSPKDKKTGKMSRNKVMSEEPLQGHCRGILPLVKTLFSKCHGHCCCWTFLPLGSQHCPNTLPPVLTKGTASRAPRFKCKKV